MTTSKALNSIIPGIILSLNILLTPLLLYSLYLVATNAPVNPDAGYYLGSARRIAEGYIPFRDLAIHYSPLGMYILAGASKFFKNDLYGEFLSVILLVEIAGALLVGLCLKRIGVSAALQYLGGLFTLFATLYYQGIYIVLEPFETVFALLALYILLGNSESRRRSSLFLSGTAVALSFLSKQYGALVVLPLIYGITIRSGNIRQKIIDLFVLAMGCITPVVLGLIVLESQYSIPPMTVWSFLGGQNYPFNITSSTEVIKFFYEVTPFVLLLPLFNGLVSQEIQIVGLSALVYSSPLIFNQYPHHFIPIIAFIAIIGVWMVDRATKINYSPLARNATQALILICLVDTIFAASMFLLPLRNTTLRKEQLAIAAELNSVAPKRSRTTILGNPGYLFLGDFLPAKAELFGYGFLNAFKASSIRDIILCSEYLIEDRNDGYYHVGIVELLRRDNVSLEELLALNAELIKTFTDRFYVWKIKATCPLDLT